MQRPRGMSRNMWFLPSSREKLRARLNLRRTEKVHNVTRQEVPRTKIWKEAFTVILQRDLTLWRWVTAFPGPDDCKGFVGWCASILRAERNRIFPIFKIVQLHSQSAAMMTLKTELILEMLDHSASQPVNRISDHAISNWAIIRLRKSELEAYCGWYLECLRSSFVVSALDF
jgi:hypothetical protein